MLHIGAAKSEFTFYPDCEELVIINIMFADDMFIMSSVDAVSFQCIKSVLKEFGEVAGLVPNLEKSNIFVAGGNVEVAKSLSRFINIPIGILPIRYLGVPLTSKKFWWIRLHRGCKTGSAQKCIDDIDSMMRAFGRGLEIKNLFEWNKANMISKLWNICSKKDTIWVKWVNTVRLEGKSIWAYKKASKDSWVWKYIWKHREWLYQFVEIKSRDGKDTLIWSDPWLEGKSFEDWLENIKGKLVHLVTLTVADVKASTNGWRWPTGRRLTREVQVFRDKVDTVVLDPASKDRMGWKSISKERSVVRRIYKTLVEPGRKERWAKVVWFRHNVPRHSFILWLLVLERLETRHRVVKWKNGFEIKCSFCDENVSRKHVFFQCDFLGNMWRRISNMLGLYICNREWEWELQWWMNVNTSCKLRKMLLKVATAATVYWFWREGNSILHGRVARCEADIRRLKRTRRDWEFAVMYFF
ncbi:reverse transcriptase [Lithospermum erythrorhizon]|uniref:Reverse transcriptase n=1 Tax=Lithospermum erythrorhizon TaxID=34254 RepID=A0AAV3R2N7_LITER